VDAATITAAVTGVRFAMDSLKGIADGKVQIESQTRVLEALQKLGVTLDALFQMREQLIAFQLENEKLKKELAADYAWDERSSKYALTETDGKAVVYKFKEEPQHYACPNCWNDQRIEPLQTNRSRSGRYTCTSCKADFPIEPNTQPPVKRGIVSGGSGWT
jgi:predicted RNA-binding Zn-ribbon protein involved in translation (DUF1610 family)